MAPLDRLSASALASGPDDRQIIASILDGAVFTYLLADEPAQWAASLPSVLDGVAGPQMRIARVANPLRAKLTIERILIQAAGSETDSRIEHDPALIASVLAAPVANETQVLIVVEQPETLDAAAISLLQSVRPHLEGAEPRVQFLFVGVPAVAELLAPSDPAPGPAVTEAEAPPPARAPRRNFILVKAAALVVAAVAAAVAWRLGLLTLPR